MMGMYALFVLASFYVANALNVSNMTYSEFKELQKTRVSPPTKPYTSSPNKTNSPPVVDWRYIMTPIKDQAQCGSCYAESSVATYEAMWTIHTGRKHNFSVQQAMDCSTTQGNEGCNGGWMHSVYDWIITNEGIELNSEDPYTAITANCTPSLNKTQIAFLDNWVYVKPTQKDIISWLPLQPVTVAVAADGCWQEYTSGIVTGKKCPSSLDPPELDHGVVVVGYDLTHKIPHFTVRNSWGTGWGEDGYIRIAINFTHDKGLFGIASQPTAPLIQ